MTASWAADGSVQYEQFLDAYDEMCTDRRARAKADPSVTRITSDLSSE
jgi:hypothetical protein